jgi:hypothetical protein
MADNKSGSVAVIPADHGGTLFLGKTPPVS